MVTKKQRDFLEKLKNFYGKDPLPSYDVICQDLGFKSKNSIWQYFQKLIDENLICSRNNRYFLSGELFGINFYRDGVRAGFPTQTEDNPVEKINLEDLLIDKLDDTFSVRVAGDSMIDAGIYEDDLVIVNTRKPASNGDIVVARVDGDYTMKYYYKTNGEVRLEPANANYPTIKPEHELVIVGVVTGLVRTF